MKKYLCQICCYSWNETREKYDGDLCPVCGADDWKLDENGELPLLRCDKCGKPFIFEEGAYRADCKCIPANYRLTVG